MSINLSNISGNNFNNICRTCSQKNDLVSILQNTYLIGMLSTVTQIQIQLNDDLPKMICLNCVKDLNKSYSFICKCKATDLTLRQRYSKQKFYTLKVKEESIKPKMTEEIFIKTEIIDLDDYNDPLSQLGTKDPLEHQENQGKEFENKTEEETNADRLSNDKLKKEVSPRRKRKRSASNVKPAKSPTKNENKQSRSQSESNKKSATENVRSSRKERSKTETSSSRKTKENDENTARSRIHEPLVMIKIGKHTMIDFAAKGRHKNGRSATNRHGEPPN